jgi:hypothetical protein
VTLFSVYSVGNHFLWILCLWKMFLICAIRILQWDIYLSEWTGNLRSQLETIGVFHNFVCVCVCVCVCVQFCFLYWCVKQLLQAIFLCFRILHQLLELYAFCLIVPVLSCLWRCQCKGSACPATTSGGLHELGIACSFFFHSELCSFLILLLYWDFLTE